MIKNYFKTAWRNLLKNKTFSLINIIGLAVSMSVCLLIIMIVADQKSYDQFHADKDRIYRVHTAGTNGNSMLTATSSFPLGDELQKNYTGIEAVSTLVRKIGGDIFYNDKIASGGGYFADAGLFKVMDYKLEEGDVKTALNNPFSLVISKELATHLFYNENPIGKIVKFNDKGISPGGFETGNKETAYGQFIITGVLKDNPGKTSLQFKLLASLSTINALNKDSILNIQPGDWNNVWESYTYVLMGKGKTKTDLQLMLDKIAQQHYSGNNNEKYVFKATGLSEITPGPLIGNPTSTTLPEGVLLFLGILSLIVMLSACLNYTNLSVARSLTRVKEVGIRKVSGASRKQIFYQFITESVLISLVALLFSLLLLFFLQSLFAGLWLNKFFNISFSYNIKLFFVFIAFSIGTGVLAGLLPAAYISVCNPIEIFKNINRTKIFKGLTIRKVLLVIQFTVSLIFIISASLIYLQTKHVFNFDYGFNKDNVINIKLYKAENYQRFVQAIASHKNIRSVGACAFPPAVGIQNGTQVYKVDRSKKDSLQAGFIDIDANCVDVWGLQLIAGKNLPVIPSLNGNEQMLVNEKMITAFGYTSPAAAVGQHLQVDGNTVEITGVVKDFQYATAESAIEPLMLRNRQSQFGYVVVRVAGNTPAETLGFLQTQWKKVNPSTKFEYEFFDQQLLFFHSILSDAASVVGLIAMLAVFISCLGLLGMAAYTAETKQKEIGIRKVLGSGILQIIFLLSKSFMLLLGIAVLIGTPVAYLLNNVWLQFFASRVSINPLVLLTAVLMLTAISFVIVFSQAWRAGRVNPIKSLRTE